MTLMDEPSSVISTQYLFAAGFYAQGDAKEEAISNLIGSAQRRTGWPVACLKEELKSEWAKSFG